MAFMDNSMQRLLGKLFVMFFILGVPFPPFWIIAALIAVCFVYVLFTK